MRLQWLELLAVVATPATAAPETPFGFVSVYLREIASIDEYRAQAAANQAAQPHDMAGCVHDTEAWQLEVKGASSALGAMTLPAGNPAQQAPQLIAEGLRDKAQSINEIEEVCAAMIAGPRDGVDYSAMVARAPRARARLEAADKALFTGAVLAFASLISMREDSQGRASFLVIDREQRNTLLTLIADRFGKRIDLPNQGYAVDIAKLFRDKLNEYHTSDQR